MLYTFASKVVWTKCWQFNEYLEGVAIASQLCLTIILDVITYACRNPGAVSVNLC